MTARGPLEFRPMQGLLSLLDRLAEHLGMGTHEVYAGEDGIREVAAAKLRECGIPQDGIPLTGSESKVTPRELAEHAGFIRKRKRLKK